MYQVPMKMEKSASFHDYGGMKSATVFLGIEPLLQRAASTGDAQLLLTLLQVLPQMNQCCIKVIFFGYLV